MDEGRGDGNAHPDRRPQSVCPSQHRPQRGAAEEEQSKICRSDDAALFWVSFAVWLRRCGSRVEKVNLTTEIKPALDQRAEPVRCDHVGAALTAPRRHPG